MSLLKGNEFWIRVQNYFLETVRVLFKKLLPSVAAQQLRPVSPAFRALFGLLSHARRGQRNFENQVLPFSNGIVACLYLAVSRIGNDNSPSVLLSTPQLAQRDSAAPANRRWASKKLLSYSSWIIGFACLFNPGQGMATRSHQRSRCTKVFAIGANNAVTIYTPSIHTKAFRPLDCADPWFAQLTTLPISGSLTF
ncbi:MAG: hypothetical protein JO097_12390 [Acidobacteriaceae bacterium]|nr:hypothetical protein [Acidobacteriaceae bacterium]